MNFSKIASAFLFVIALFANGAAAEAGCETVRHGRGDFAVFCDGSILKGSDRSTRDEATNLSDKMETEHLRAQIREEERLEWQAGEPARKAAQEAKEEAEYQKSLVSPPISY